MRTLDSAVSTVIAGQDIWPVRLLDIQIGDTVNRICDHYSNLTFSGNTYLGNGNLLTITTVPDTTSANLDSVEIGLSVIDESFRADILDADSIGGEVKVYRGFLSTTTGNLVANPTLLYEGIIFAGVLSQEYPIRLGDTVYESAFTVSVDVRATTFRLDERPGRHTNLASAHEVDDTDNAFEFIAGLNGRQFTFGGTT